MENKSMPPHRPPGVLRVILLALGSLLWALIGALMGLSAIVGLACAVLGTLSLFVDLNSSLEMQLGDESVRTTAQKILFAAVGAVMAIAGIGFWWLRLRGHFWGALLCYAVLLGLFLAVAWTSGSASVISVGGANP
jgi:hypothetical protein